MILFGKRTILNCWLRTIFTCSALLIIAATACAQTVVLAAPSGPPTGLADFSSLRATVFGTPPQDLAPLPKQVPLEEMDLVLPWERPVPAVFWFDRRLRVWISAQPKPAPLAIVIAGTGSDGDNPKMSILRAALYGAGYHVLTVPSPTFPRFIVAASSTGVAGDLLQDSRDLYATLQQVMAHLPHSIKILDVDVLGYSLGGANAAVIKSLDADEHKLHIHRVVMINPPVNLFASVSRLDQLFTASIGPGESGIEKLYQRLYTRLANFYRRSGQAPSDDDNLLTVAAAALKTESDFSAAIALNFRLALVDIFFAGDLYTGTGIVVDPRHPPRVGDPLENTQRILRDKPFAEYFSEVFAPYYLARRPNSTAKSLMADSSLGIVGKTLHDDSDYYAQTNSDDPILDEAEFGWLKTTLGKRLAIYNHGGHLGNLGDRQQIADMLDMLAGHWPSGS